MIDLECPTMPRRPTSTPRKGETPGRRAVAITIKGTDEWRTWVEKGAQHCRLSVAALVDLAVVRYLKAEGFTEKPPER